MNNVLAPGRAPANDAELVRSFHERLRKLENPDALRIGPWVIRNDLDTGNLLATRPGTSVELGGSGEPVVVELKGGGVSKEELTSAITGQGDSGDLQIIKRIFANLSNFLSGIDFNDPLFDVENAAQTFVETVVQPLIDAVAALGKLSISWLTNEQQNMVTEGGYDSPATIVVGSGFVHDATDGVPGTLPLGCAKVTADGTDHQMAPKLFEVGQGWQLRAGSRVKWEGLTTSGPDPIRIDIQPYKQTGPDTFDLVGPQLMVASVPTPAAASGGLAGWGTGPIQGTWTVPSDGSVSHVALLDHVTGAALSGSVKYDQTFMYPIQDIPQEWVNGLIAQLTSLYDWIETWVLQGLAGLGITPTGTLNDMINDLADGLSDIQNAAEDAMAGLAEKLGLDQWDEQMNELKDIFDGLIIDPLTSLGNTIGSWFTKFFSGGAQQVVTHDQVAAESGIPPTDGNTKIPWVYLPEELMSVGMGLPWTLVSKTGANQPLASATDTLLTGWAPSGPGGITITGNKFKLPFDGMWFIEAFVVFSNTGTHKINIKQNDVLIRETPNTLSTDRGILGFMLPASTEDEFGFYAYSAGTPTVQTAYTFLRFTYMGITTVPSLPPAPDPVLFGAAGASGHGTGTIFWNHTFTADDTAVVVPVSQESPNTPVISISGAGGGTIPVLDGPTDVGAAFGAASRSCLAAVMLPPGVAGTTRTITVNFGGAGNAASANSMSFKNVGSLGGVKKSAGSSSPKLLVPSNVSSMVVCQFAGVTGNFSDFNRTLVNDWDFVVFDTWAHMIGYGVGGSLFSASGGRWVAKGIELVPVSP